MLNKIYAGILRGFWIMVVINSRPLGHSFFLWFLNLLTMFINSQETFILVGTFPTFMFNEQFPFVTIYNFDQIKRNPIHIWLQGK